MYRLQIRLDTPPGTTQLPLRQLPSCPSCAFGCTVLAVAGAPAVRSLFARQTLSPSAGPFVWSSALPSSSATNTSSFHTSTRSLTLSRHASPARHAASRCAADTAINMLSSPIGTGPSLCTTAMPIRLCSLEISRAMESIVRSASGRYAAYRKVATARSPKLSRVEPWEGLCQRTSIIHRKTGRKGYFTCKKYIRAGLGAADALQNRINVEGGFCQSDEAAVRREAVGAREDVLSQGLCHDQGSVRYLGRGSMVRAAVSSDENCGYG